MTLQDGSVDVATSFGMVPTKCWRAAEAPGLVLHHAHTRSGGDAKHYAITHDASGCFVMHVATKRLGVAAIEGLAALGAWTRSADELMADAPFRAAVRAFLDTWYETAGATQ